MNRSTVEILFHQENIAHFLVSSDELEIVKIHKTQNPNFLFVTVETKELKAGHYQINFRRDRKSFSYDYELKERKAQEDRAQNGFDASDVIYLLMPDRFSNGDPKNDNAKNTIEKVDRENPGGRHGGDIEGIINHLDYLDELGVTAIWSTPMLLDNDTAYSYHTYGQGDVYQIDPRFGSNEDYRRLGAELHNRDMKLIMDYVTNHWGTSHWMMEDLPEYNWIHQFPGYAQSNYRMTTQYDPNASDVDLKFCEKGWFVPTMPDLNQSNSRVLTYLIQNAIWWIEYANLDGFRVDTYSYNNKEGIATWTKAIMEEYPNFNIVGEVWLHDQAQISYWQKDSPLGALQNYNSGCPSVMDFTLHDAIIEAFGETEANWFDGMIKVYENFVNDFLYQDPNQLLVFLENHDTPRFNEIYPDFRDYQLGLSLIATTRGIPQIYYGSELGMRGDKNEGDGDIRRDFPGGWEGDGPRFPENELGLGRSYYHDFTKRVLNWRKSKTVIHEGKLKHYLPENNVYVYFRYTDDESVMVIINNSDMPQDLSLNRFEESLGEYESGLDILKNETIDLTQESIEIWPKTSLIIELNQ